MVKIATLKPKYRAIFKNTKSRFKAFLPNEGFISTKSGQYTRSLKIYFNISHGYQNIPLPLFRVRFPIVLYFTFSVQ